MNERLDTFFEVLRIGCGVVFGIARQLGFEFGVSVAAAGRNNDRHFLAAQDDIPGIRRGAIVYVDGVKSAVLGQLAHGFGSECCSAGAVMCVAVCGN